LREVETVTLDLTAGDIQKGRKSAVIGCPKIKKAS